MRSSSKSGGYQPPPPTPNALERELMERQIAQVRRSAGKDQMASMVIYFMTIFGVGSSVGFLTMELGKDGFGAVDFGVCAAVAIGAVLGISYMWSFGAETLPKMPRLRRESIVPVYIAGMAIWAKVSMGTAVIFMALAPAKDADFRLVTTNIIEQSINVETAHSELYALIPSIYTQATAITGAAEDEYKFGGFCGAGGGRGQCHSFLRTTAVQTVNAAEDLEAAKRLNTPIMERMASNRDAIMRILENPGYSYEERTELVTQRTEALIVDTTALQAALNVQSVRQLRDTFTMDFDTAGLTPLGARKMRGLVKGSVQNLEDTLRGAVRNSEIVLADKQSTIPLAIIMRNFGAVWPLVLFGMLPELITAFIVFVCFLTSRAEHGDRLHDQPSSEASNPDPSGLNGAATAHAGGPDDFFNFNQKDRHEPRH